MKYKLHDNLQEYLGGGLMEVRNPANKDLE